MTRIKSAAIQTKRLALLPMTPDFLIACLAGDRSRAAGLIGAQPAAEWLEEKRLMAARLAQLEFDPSLQPWLLRAIVRRPEPTMVGHIGFHSRPGPDYLADIAPHGLELGYTIFPAFQRQGYATEACRTLMAWASGNYPQVQFVVSIRPDNEPSLRIAQKFGFQQVSSHIDPEDGLELIFVRQPGP